MQQIEFPKYELSKEMAWISTLICKNFFDLYGGKQLTDCVYTRISLN